MKYKKRILSFVLAALAMAAFAVPSMASAEEWTYEGSPITEQAGTEITQGWVKWEVGGGAWGYICEFNATVTLTPWGKGEINPSFPNCEGRGALSGLTAEGVAVGAPWVLQGKENGTAGISDFALELNWQPEGIAGRTVTTGELILSPENPFTIGASAITSIGTVTNGTTPAAMTGEVIDLTDPHYGWAE